MDKRRSSGASRSSFDSLSWVRFTFAVFPRIVGRGRGGAYAVPLRMAATRAAPSAPHSTTICGGPPAR